MKGLHGQVKRRKPYLRQGNRKTNLPKNTRNGLLNNGRMYYGVMKQNLKFSLQREDSMKEGLESR